MHTLRAIDSRFLLVLPSEMPSMRRSAGRFGGRLRGQQSAN
jgi:hypothetical protein